ncbi:MAG: XrtA system polysaccharide deacetylase, partial [Gemmatimonadales bacterium]
CSVFIPMIRHHFTVDVEEYFQVSALDRAVHREEWGRIESRLAPTISFLLEVLERHGARGTFFVLGWVAQRHPDLIRAIARAGHEIASHGWEHRRVTDQTPIAFREEVRRTKATLEALTGQPVAGYRAPSFSIVRGREWALDVLADEGYRYDSSLFPVRRPGGRYGYPGGKPDPHWLRRRGRRLAEVPPTTLPVLGMRLPAAGGAYFRLFPYCLTRSALRTCEARGVPGTFYIHPWELDPGQPRLDVPWTTRLRHYGGLDRTRKRLLSLLREFQFTTIATTVATL